jgi:hypothetical protein
VRFESIEVDEALEIADQTRIKGWTNKANGIKVGGNRDWMSANGRIWQPTLSAKKRRSSPEKFMTANGR